MSAYLILSITGKLVQPLNASAPIEITESGIVTEDRLAQPSNAKLLINLTPLLILKFVISLSNTSTKQVSAYLTLSIIGKLVHPSNV